MEFHDSVEVAREPPSRVGDDHAWTCASLRDWGGGHAKGRHEIEWRPQGRFGAAHGGARLDRRDRRRRSEQRRLRRAGRCGLRVSDLAGDEHPTPAAGHDRIPRCAATASGRVRTIRCPGASRATRGDTRGGHGRRHRSSAGAGAPADRAAAAGDASRRGASPRRGRTATEPAGAVSLAPATAAASERRRRVARVPVRRQHRRASRCDRAARRGGAARQVRGRQRALPDRDASRVGGVDRSGPRGRGLPRARRAAWIRHQPAGRRHRGALSRGVLRVPDLWPRAGGARLHAVRRHRRRVRRSRRHAERAAPAGDRQSRWLRGAAPGIDGRGQPRLPVRLLPRVERRRGGGGVVPVVAGSAADRVRRHLRRGDGLGRAPLPARRLCDHAALRDRVPRALHRCRHRARVPRTPEAARTDRRRTRVRHAAAEPARPGTARGGHRVRLGDLRRRARRRLHGAGQLALARAGSVVPSPRRSLHRARGRFRHDGDPARLRDLAHRHRRVGVRGRGALLDRRAPGAPTRAILRRRAPRAGRARLLRGGLGRRLRSRRIRGCSPTDASSRVSLWRWPAS